MRRYVAPALCVLLFVDQANAQRGGGDWMTAGNDAQRSNWVRSDAKISVASLSKPGFEVVWKIKPQNKQKGLNSITSPSALEFIIGHKGFRSLGFFGTSGDRVIGMDVDLGVVEWERNFASAASPSGPGTAECPGGMTAAVTRPATTSYPANFGGAGRGRSGPPKGSVGEPHEGAVTLIRDYVRHHRAETPAFAHLPNEFLRYLAATEHAARPPYLGELAHFEWLENCLSIDQRRVELTAIDRTGDLLNGEIVVNPIHRVESYRYPVHVIEAGFKINESMEPIHLVAFRDLANEFQFLELNTLALRLFCTIRDTPEINAAQVLRDISEALGRHDPNPVLAGGLNILERMRKRQLILGTRAN